MATPSFSELKSYAGKLLTNTDWDVNFKKIVSWLTDGTYTLTMNTLSAVTMALTGNLTVAGTVTGGSFVGDGSALTNTLLPIGTILPFASSVIPANYLLCNGQSVAKTGTYAGLYAVIGEQYGSTAINAFSLPDFRGMSMRGAMLFPDTTITNTVDTVNDIILCHLHGMFRNGFAIQFTNSGGALPGGLSVSTQYFARILSVDEFYVYDTQANAVAGGATGLINLTSNGTGTNKIVQTIDAGASTRTSLNTGGASGDALGSFESDRVASHIHGITTYLTYGSGATEVILRTAENAHTPNTALSTEYYPANTLANNETTVKNVSVNFIIRAL